jgi:hypothetical protein
LLGSFRGIRGGLFNGVADHFASSDRRGMWPDVEPDYVGFGVVEVSPVPAPGAVLLGILGLGTAGWRLRRSACGTNSQAPAWSCFPSLRVSVKIDWHQRREHITLYLLKDYKIRRTLVSSKISKEQLRHTLSGDIEQLLEDVAKAVNEAQPGHIIDQSEEPVRDAAGQFRQKLFAKALELRGQREAFSPGRGPQRCGA